MRYLEVNLACRGNDKPFDLGYKGENIVTGVIFDYSSWRELYGVGALTLAVQPSGNSNPYPVTLTVIDDTHALWTLTKTVLNEEGAGRCQLTYVVGEAIKKSAVFVYKAGYSMDATGEIPDPYISYFEQILETGAQVQADAAAAEQAKEDAETAAQDARASADEIENMTATAETLPAGSDATAEYSDGTLSLGIPQGVPGNEGPQGPPGPTGNGIQSTVLNADYTLTITFTNGSTYTTPSIRGPQGPDGETGPTGKGIKSTVLNSDYTLTITFTDDTTYTTPSIRGEQGEQGDPGVVQDVTVNGTSVLDGAIAKVVIPQITKTVTGNPIVIDDADGEVKSLNVELTPIQDLHGYDKPWAGGAGVNLFDMDSAINGYLSAGGTIVTPGDKENMVSDFIPVEEDTIYTYSAQTTEDHDFWTGWCFYSAKDISSVIGSRSTVFMNTYTIQTPTNAKYIRIGSRWLENGGKAQFEKGSTATSWTPYENICPISPHTSVGVRDTGVNQWDEQWEVGSIIATNGIPTADNTRIRAKNFNPCLANTLYYAIDPTSDNNISFRFYDADKNYLGYGSGWMGNATFITPDNCAYFKFVMGMSYGTTYHNDIAINYPSTDHDYHPYTGQTVTVPLNDLYGGNVDVIGGQDGEETWGYVDLGTLWWSYYKYGDNTGGNSVGIKTIAKHFAATDTPTAKCTALRTVSDNVFNSNTNTGADITINALGDLKVTVPNVSDNASLKVALSGIYLAFELATPTPLITTPTPLTLYKGDNVVSSDGDVELTYARNLQAVITSIEDRLSALEG